MAGNPCHDAPWPIEPKVPAGSRRPSEAADEKTEAMLARFRSGEYGPELVRLMIDALESAWGQALGSPQDAELGRLIMASAIIDQVDLGVRVHEELARSATAALAAATRLSCGGLRSRA
jgi:hypothetical protein